MKENAVLLDPKSTFSPNNLDDRLSELLKKELINVGVHDNDEQQGVSFHLLLLSLIHGTINEPEEIVINRLKEYIDYIRGL